MLSRSIRALLPALLLIVAPGGAAFAAWPHDPYTNLLVNGDNTSQEAMTMATDGAGGMYVAWSDNRAGTADVYLQQVRRDGTMDLAVGWPSNGLVVCNEAGGQGSPTLVPDGSGGVIALWFDGRPAGLNGVYAQHVLASGQIDPAWPVNGRPLCAGIGMGGPPKGVSDGAGGAIAVWYDFRGASTDIYAQRILASGIVDPEWQPNGRLLCGAASTQWFQQIVSDGQGGAIAVWEDLRTGTSDIYARRVLSNGTPDPAWPVDGRAVCTAANAQANISIVADGASGAWFAWTDARSGTNDVYVQRLNSAGAQLPGWFNDGLLVVNAANVQDGIQIVTDGSGGVIAVWSDMRSGARDLYAMRVLPYGSVHLGWPVGGLVISTAAGTQSPGTLVPDGSGGVFVGWHGQDGASSDITAHHVRGNATLDTSWPAGGLLVCGAPASQWPPFAIADDNGGVLYAWPDYRSAAVIDLYGQRVSRTGVLGMPEPVFSGVADVPNDQGGQVKLSWEASWLDYDTTPALVDHYRVYRSVPSSVAAMRSTEELRARRGEDALLAELASATGYAWEWIANVDAQNASFITQYSYVAPTLGDSTGDGNPATAFLVAGFNLAGDRYWYSLPASGYSVDDLAPAVPAPFTAAYEGGATHLHWDANDEPDFAYYNLYRGDSPSFVPGPGNLVAAPPDTGHVDAGDAGGYYKLSAVDMHGNESGFALLGPANTLDVGGAVVTAFALARPQPNPAVDRAVMRFALPGESRVRLTVHDLAGREVRTLLDGVLPAGEHAQQWNLRDAAGTPLPAGLYFLRLEANGRRATQRLAVTH